MSIDNVKLLNEIHHNFVTILEKYSNNKAVLNKVNEYVTTKLENHIHKIHKEVDDKESTQKERDYFINNFLSSIENIYYYVKEKELFIHYDMKHYKCFEEDEICSQIYNDIIKDYTSLMNYKFDIQNEIINEYKTQALNKCIPESYTIQSVIKYLMTYFFDSKDNAKYFCCILGDLILGKKIDNVFCINSNLYQFITTFQNIINGTIDNVSILNDKFTINELNLNVDIKTHRILYSSNVDKLCLWNDFLNRHAIDIYVVCIHYSRRYLNSEKYLNHHKTPHHILYLKTNDVKNIVKTFGLQKISVDQNSSITYENMKFLWYKYLKSKQIPTNIIPIPSLHKEMLSYAKYDTINSNYLCVSHDDNKLIINIKQFMDSYIVNDSFDQLEISEIVEIYKNQHDHDNINESIMIEIIKYFTQYTFVNDDKTITNVKCLLWDKKGELFNFIDLMKSSHQDGSWVIEENLSFNTIYTKYCKYTSNNGNVNKIVTKKYFIEFILSSIPENNIRYNKILQSYWSK